MTFEKIKLIKGKVVTDNLRTSQIIKEHFIEKGFFNVEVKTNMIPDDATQ